MRIWFSIWLCLEIWIHTHLIQPLLTKYLWKFETFTICAVTFILYVYFFFYFVSREVWDTKTLIPHHLGILIVPIVKRTAMNFGTCQSSDEVIFLHTFLNAKIVLHNIHASHLMGWKEVVHLIYKTVRAASFMKLSYYR